MQEARRNSVQPRQTAALPALRARCRPEVRDSSVHLKVSGGGDRGHDDGGPSLNPGSPPCPAAEHSKSDARDGRNARSPFAHRRIDFGRITVVARHQVRLR
jgi:hypothetical protein